MNSHPYPLRSLMYHTEHIRAHNVHRVIVYNHLKQHTYIHTAAYC